MPANVVVIWECELANLGKLECLAARLPYLIKRKPMEYRFEEESNLPMVAEEASDYLS